MSKIPTPVLTGSLNSGASDSHNEVVLGSGPGRSLSPRRPPDILEVSNISSIFLEIFVLCPV